MKKKTRKTPTHTFQCEDSLWERLLAIAADRGAELSLEPSRLASSVVRTAVEHYVAQYEQRKAKEAAFLPDNSLDKPIERKATKKARDSG
jgi:hypothetical protein